jgi:hypothetical protein
MICLKRDCDLTEKCLHCPDKLGGIYVAIPIDHVAYHVDLLMGWMNLSKSTQVGNLHMCTCMFQNLQVYINVHCTSDTAK